MKSTPLIAIIFAVLLISLTSCRTNPVQNVADQSIMTNEAKYTETDVKKSIIRAGVALGWAMNAKQPGHIVATLNIRAHMAQVDIKYNMKTYSITYKDSSNLNYDDQSSEIHSNYNGWIQNLDRGIKAQLTSI